MATESADFELLASPRASWEALRFPATAINLPGPPAGAPQWDTTKNGWLFDADGTEDLMLIAEMPHDWIEGTEIKPYVRWEKTTSASGTVYWNLNYQISVADTVRTSAQDLPAYTAITPSDTADVQQITSFGAIDMAGLKVSTIIIITLSRVGANGNDSYGADARLLEFDIHYQRGQWASRQEYIK